MALTQVQSQMLGGNSGSNATITAVGTQTLPVNSGNNNTAVGYQSGYVNSTGLQNTYVGYQSGYSNTTGSNNVFVGQYAGYNNSTGSGNTSLGYSAFGGVAGTNTSSSNTAIGMQTLYNTVGAFNTALGYQAGFSTTSGTYNTYLGCYTGYSNQTGSSNTFIGQYTGYSTTGGGNCFVGGGSAQAAGYYVTTGSNNTILGGFNGNQGGIDIRTSSNNIVLSDGDGNARFIGDGGYYTKLNVPSGNRYIQWDLCIGNTAVVASYYDTVTPRYYLFATNNGVYLAQNGTSWVSNSDARLKENVADIEYGLDAVMAIKPRRFDWIESQKSDIGFIAQELRDVIPEAVNGEEIEFEDDDSQQEKASKTLGVSKDTLIPVLVKAIQEQQALITNLQTRLTALEAK